MPIEQRLAGAPMFEATQAIEARTLASLADLPDTGAMGAACDLFSTRDWFENLRRFGMPADARAFAVSVRQGGGDTGMCLPLLIEPHGAAALFGPVLGGLSNFYSSLFGPIGRPEDATVDACRALLRHVRAPVIDLRPLDTDAAFYKNLQRALAAEGYWSDSYFCFGNWYLRVDGRSFDAYFPTVPSRIRNTIRRGRKKLDAAGAWTMAVHAEPGPALEQAIVDFDAIYRQSWKVPEPFPEFVPNLCRMAARRGWLRLGVLRLDGTPVAAQIWFVKDGHALIFKLAYDENFKRLSAGSVLTQELMRRAIDEERVHEVDYLTGDDDYKADWMSHRRERRGIVAFDPRSPRGLASAARHYAGRWWRRHRARGAMPAAPAAPGAPAVPGAAEPSDE